MAQTLANIRAKTRTSIHGRQLGLADDFLGGVKDIRRVVTDVTASASVLPNHGVIGLAGLLSTYVGTLTSPEPGVTCFIGMTSTGTTNKWVITSASTAATFTSTKGTLDTKITFTGQGAHVNLVGLSTAVWLVLTTQTTDAGGAVAS